VILRVVIAEQGQPPLPALPVAISDERAIVVGAAASANIRLPLGAVVSEHLELRRLAGNWHYIAHGDAMLRGKPVAAGDRGMVKFPCELAIDRWVLQIDEVADGSMSPVSPMRTASLARELARSMMSGSNAPSLTIVGEGSRRELPPPEVRITIGRGDDADWQIADDDLSRLHIAIERSWDGVRLLDLESKNGTKVDGLAVPVDGLILRHRAMIALGRTTLRFDDPAEQIVDSDGHESPLPLHVEPLVTSPVASTQPGWMFATSLGICLLATAAIVWLVIAALNATPVVH
jgi:hypothetical protein